MKAEREADVLKAVRQFLELSGWLVIRVNAGMAWRGEHPVHLADPGVSDLIAFAPDQPALFVEVKSATGRLRPSQKSFADLVRRKGHNYVCVRSVAQMQAALKELEA